MNEKINKLKEENQDLSNQINGNTIPTTIQQQLDEVQKKIDEKDYEISRLNKLIEENNSKHNEECIFI